MDSRKEHAIILEYNNQIIKFQECRDGLYYSDTANNFISHIKSYFLSTVKYKIHTLALQKFKEWTRLENYNRKLFGHALLITRE